MAPPTRTGNALIVSISSLIMVWAGKHGYPMDQTESLAVSALAVPAWHAIAAAGAWVWLNLIQPYLPEPRRPRVPLEPAAAPQAAA